MKTISGHTELYALIGYPAKHSLSPFIHNYFFKKYNLDAVYLSFEVLPEDFKTALLGSSKLRFSGINLTMPFKEDSLKYIDRLDENSSASGSVNTIKFNKHPENIEGFNTDISGFKKSLDDHNFDCEKSKCLVIGAGGSAKSIVYALLKNNVEIIYIHNRNSSKAYEIKFLYDKTNPGKIIVAEDFNQVPIREIDIIINCTPIGMRKNLYNEDNLIPVPLSWNLKNKFVFEMVYNPVVTSFIKKAISDGSQVIYGTEILLNQAAFSFEIWTGVFPDLTYLKKHFKNIILK
jgi:shikimate dehydrogenase